MATGDELANLRRRRGYCSAQFTRLAKKLGDIEQSGCPDEFDLLHIKDRLETYEKDIRALQYQIVTLDEGETARGSELEEEYERLQRRVAKQLSNTRRSTPSQSTSGESAVGRESAPLKLPEVRIPTFDGALEDWQSFHDAFSSAIDRNENLAPVQKFHHLRTALTGWAARSIQSLPITDANYAIAMDALREKFDCHRQICMRHWDLILDYPRITKETPEAIDDLIETVKVHLQALERLGDPVTSNAFLIKLVTSKLPSAVVREWQHTLPDKKLPPYTHLVDFLKTRTNSDRACSSLTVKRGASEQHDRRRQDAPRSYTFVTTHNTLLCPSCHEQHELWNCHVFKTMPPKERLEIAKRASLCTNCLGKGHALTQCSAGSCRICRQRHHTYLHQDQGHSKTRTRVDRTSSGRSSSDRSSSGRSSPSSPSPRSSYRSRRSSSSPRAAHRGSRRDSRRESPRASPRTSPRASRRDSRRESPRTSPRTSPKRESRLPRSSASGSTISSSPKRQGKQ